MVRHHLTELAWLIDINMRKKSRDSFGSLLAAPGFSALSPLLANAFKLCQVAWQATTAALGSLGQADESTGVCLRVHSNLIVPSTSCSFAFLCHGTWRQLFAVRGLFTLPGSW
jgi:hypothetical protein